MVTKEIAVQALTDILDAIDSAPEPVLRLARRPGPVSLADFDTNYELFNSPVGESLRVGVTELGKVLGKHFTLDEMREIAEEASGRAGSKIGIDVCDKRWNGLEDKNGAAWWS